MKKLNLVDQKFNRLLVISKTKNKRNKTAYLCLCDCGNEIIVTLSDLKSNHTKSCGCLSVEVRKIQLQNLHISNKKYDSRILSARDVWRRYKKEGLSFEDFYELSQKNCFYCDCLPINNNNGEFYYNGLDRIDSSLGHTIDNVVSCCKDCNFAKQDMTVKEFYEWVNKIYSYLLNNGKI